MISGKLGRFPYIRSPTRYIFPVIQIIPTVVVMSSTMELKISMKGGSRTQTRRSMRIGEKNGINESTIDSGANDRIQHLVDAADFFKIRHILRCKLNGSSLNDVFRDVHVSGNIAR